MRLPSMARRSYGGPMREQEPRATLRHPRWWLFHVRNYRLALL
jgi:hypothetical protein